ncbi:hypothetical protein [Halobellus sp. GM3]
MELDAADRGLRRPLFLAFVIRPSAARRTDLSAENVPQRFTAQGEYR